MAPKPQSRFLLGTVILNVVKDPRLHFHAVGWNDIPCPTTVALSQYNRTFGLHRSIAPAAADPVLKGHGFSRAEMVTKSPRASAPEGCLSLRPPHPSRTLRNSIVFALISLCALSLHAATYYVIVAGLGGEPDYEQRFTAAAKDLDRVFKSSGETARVYTLSGTEATAPRFRETVASVARDAKPDDDFVLILIGHGSFDGVDYKFNFVGPDLTAAQIAELCDRIAARRQLVVNTTSASGGSVPALERSGRAVIAATKSGSEKNATVFARYWVEALQDPAADVDKSDSVSAMEAFSYAAKKTAAFYDAQKRLATEHAVFDDVGRGEPVREAGNGQGQLMTSVTVLRLGGGLQANNDPAKRALLAKKEQLEQKIDALKYQKAAMDPEDYKKQLTAALVELAKAQQELDK
jgi:hypothetical protein